MREIKQKILKFGKGQKEKSLENVVFSRLFGGGGCEIRTHVGRAQTVFKKSTKEYRFSLVRFSLS